MRTLLVVVLVSLEAVGHAQATISIGPQGQFLGNGPQGRVDLLINNAGIYSHGTEQQLS
jgi:hypothetical protein